MNKLCKWIAVAESLVIVALLVFIRWPKSTFVHAEGASAFVMVNSRTGEACWAGPFSWES